MTRHGKLRKPIMLGDDGELHQQITDPVYSKDAIFCVNCSAPNLPDAWFCNQCGGSLVAQQAEAPLSSDTASTKDKKGLVRKPKLATYDPSRYNLVEKRPTEADKLIMVLLMGAVAVFFLFMLPLAISEIIVVGFLGFCGVFVSIRRYYGH